MNIFPTQYSTLSSVALNEKIKQDYGLSDTTTCRLLIHNVSDTYILEDRGTRYIFKIYRDAHRKLEEINGEIELLNALKHHGAKVSYPVTDLYGSQLQSFNAAEGTRYGALFSFAEGKVVHDFTPRQLLLFGEEMAKIHNIVSTLKLKHYRKVYDIGSMLTSPMETVKPAFAELPEEYEYLLTISEKVAEQIRQFDTSQFSYGYCHYDFLPKNFHITANNDITFFDFDFAGWGLLANDITSFYIHFFLEVNFNKITQQKVDELFAIFVEGYRNIRPLSDAELKAIPYLGFAFWIFYLGFQYQNFDDWSNTFFGPKFLKDRTALIKKWTEWYCKF